jgi:predicted transcriptional regulator of viral defense system
MSNLLSLPDTCAPDRAAALAHAVRSRGITAISHHSAAHVHGLTSAAPALVHVLALRGSHPTSSSGVIVHHTRTLDARSVVRVGDVPITDIPSTVVMMAAYSTVAELQAMIRAACRLDVSIEQLRHVASVRRRRGRAGPGRLLDALEHLGHDTRSELHARRRGGQLAPPAA